MKPNFLGIGAAKSGTTTLANILSSHPQISMSKRKELHYFDKEEFSDDEHSLNNYYKNFQTNKIIGEFTPSYLFMPKAPKRIKDCLGENIRLLAILRNPTFRAYSHYCHAVKNWRGEKYAKMGYPVEDLSFYEAIQSEPERLTSGLYHIRHQSYFSKGLYANQLKRYFEIFSKQSIKVVILEEYIANPINILNDIYDFLAIDHIPESNFTNIRLNSQSDGKLTDSDKRYLDMLYKDSIIKLETLLGRELSIWK